MFGWAVGLGAMVGLWAAGRHTPPSQQEAFWEGAAWGAIGLVLGGRAAYVAAHWGAYALHPLSALAFWEGGSAWPGALAGYLLGVAWAAFRHGLPWRALSDALLPYAAGLSLGAWLGCALKGCAYGPAMPHGWPLPDEAGRGAPRVPLQVLALVGSGALLWVVENLRTRRPPPGVPTGAALLGGGMLMGGVSLLRADPVFRWGGVPADFWAAAGMVLLGTALILWSRSER